MSDEEYWKEPMPDSPDESEDPDIEALLTIGYEQLDQFAGWLEEDRGLPLRVVQRDTFNAEALLDYLANYAHKPAAAADEYDLRWFVFSHYIRKAGADRETEERLLTSLRNFYTFLHHAHDSPPPAFLWETLDEPAFYLKRLREYAALDPEDERAWERGFRIWCEELEDDLDTRCLSLPRDLGQGLFWGDRMGWREATLREEAIRRWQQERAELLSEAMDFETARAYLLSSYFEWLETPHPHLDGRTPAEVILEERLEQGVEESVEDEAENDYP